MTAGATRSVKAIDPRSREIAENLARESGLSLSDWLGQMMAAETPEDIVSQDYFNTTAAGAYVETPRAATVAHGRFEAAEHPADEVGRVSQALDRLTLRIEAAEHRSTLAIGGVEQTVRAAIARLDGTERDTVSVAARFEGAVQEVQFEQARMAERLRRMESEAHGPRSAEALRSLEGALGKVAGHLYDGENRTRDALAQVSARVERIETEQAPTAGLADAVVSRVAARLEEAKSRTTAALRQMQASFAALDDRLGTVEGRNSTPGDTRLEQIAASLTTRVDAVRAEMAEKISGAADGRLDRMERTLSEMSDHVRTAEQRSTQAIERMGREVVDVAEALSRRVQSVEHRSADAIEQVGGEVARMAQAMESKLGRADTIQAQALEKLGGEIARIAERLSERIANSERRSAQAIDDVGEQVARVTERISARHERSTSDLADRIAQSEERTAKILEEAREKLEKLTETRRATDAQRAAVFGEEDLFVDDGFPAFRAPPPAASAFGQQPFRQRLTTSAFAYEPEPTAAFAAHAPEPAPFSQADLEAATGFAASDYSATDFAEEFEVAPEAPAFVEPEALAHETPAPAPVAAEAPFAPPPPPPVPEAAEAPTFAAPAAVEAFEAAALAGDDTVIDFVTPELAETGEEPLRPLSTREVIERGRAAALAANRPEAVLRRREPLSDASQGAEPSSVFGPTSFSRPTPRKRSSGRMAVGLLAAGATGAIGGYFYLSQQPTDAFGDALNTAVAQVRSRIGGTQMASAGQSAAPRAAVALAISPTAPSSAVPPAVTAPSSEDLAAAYAKAVAQVNVKDKAGLDEVRRLANLGYAPAQFYLAKIYEAGSNGVKADPAEARRWTERAAEAGDRRAMHNLALYYFEGTGGPKNATTAAQWFRRAAELGLVDSQYNLGRLYENGAGVTPNPAEAYKWYLIAGRSGDGDSRSSASRVAATLSNEARAAAKRSADAFHPSTATASAAPAAAPANDLATAQRALSTLGYYQGPADGTTSPALRLALAAYQRDQGLPATGAPDTVTVGKLAMISH